MVWSVDKRWDPEHATDALQLRSVAILYVRVRKDAAGDDAGVRYALARCPNIAETQSPSESPFWLFFDILSSSWLEMCWAEES